MAAGGTDADGVRDERRRNFHPRHQQGGRIQRNRTPGAAVARSIAEQLSRPWCETRGRYLETRARRSKHSREQTTRRFFFVVMLSLFCRLGAYAHILVWKTIACQARLGTDTAWKVDTCNTCGWFRFWQSLPVYSIAWSHDGRYLASCSEDGVLAVWDVGSFQSFEDSLTKTWPPVRLFMRKHVVFLRCCFLINSEQHFFTRHAWDKQPAS